MWAVGFGGGLGGGALPGLRQGCPAANPTAAVDLMGDGLNMPGVATDEDSTQMVKLITGWDRSAQQGVGDTVRHQGGSTVDRSAARTDLAVPATLLPTPDPAGTKPWIMGRQRALSIDAGPQPVFKGLRLPGHTAIIPARGYLESPALP